MNTSPPPMDWTAEAADADRSIHLSIGGEPVAGGGATIALDNPADGETGLRYSGASPEQVDQAVALAADPERGAAWWSTPPAMRGQCLQKLAELMTKNASTLALMDCMDVGKPISATQMEPHIAASMCRHFGELADKLYAGQVAASDPGCSAYHVRKPRGVVAAIVPWNYPLINATLKLAPALAAGNSVVLKPSELSPSSALLLTRLCSDAGIPPGTVSCLPGDGVTGAALAEHPGVNLISFTGSTATGKQLLQAAGRTSLKPLMLECGGKSPELVFADIKTLGLDSVAAAIVGGCMQNQGQLCVARSRLFVERPIYAEMLQALAVAMGQMKPDHPLESATGFGPLATAGQRDRIIGFITRGLADGARLLVDGRQQAGPNSNGFYLGPTLFADVDSTMGIMAEETFGPLLMVAPFDSETQAIELANSTDYGLAATAWTCDLGRTHRLIDAIETGNLQVRATAEQRFGAGWGRESEPHRQSGFGVEGGQLGVYSYSRVQSVQIDYPLT
nr:betaine aldehyde dehydrogenase-like [Nerophis lumbriciformis]